MRPKKRGGPLLAVGLIVLVIGSPVVFGLGLWFGTAHAAEKYRTVRSGDTFYVTSRGDVTVYAHAHSPDGTTGSARADAACKVRAPDGSPVNLASGTPGLTKQQDGQTYVAAGQFEAPEFGDGDYRLTCGPHDAVVEVDSSLAWAEAGHNVGEGFTIGFGYGFLTALVGGIVAICGGVWLSSSKKAIRAWDMQEYAQWQQQYAAWRASQPGQPGQTWQQGRPGQPRHPRHPGQPGQPGQPPPGAGWQ